jgi:hypothetical protein
LCETANTFCTIITEGLEFSILDVVQTSSGAHPGSYPMDTEGHFPGVKQQGRENDHSSPASAEVKKMWICKFTPPYFFMT